MLRTPPRPPPNAPPTRPGPRRVEAPRTLRPEAGRARSGRGPRSVAAPGAGGGGRTSDSGRARGPRVDRAWTLLSLSRPPGSSERTSAPGDGAARGQPGNRVRSLTGTSSEAVRRRCPGAGRAPLAAALRPGSVGRGVGPSASRGGAVPRPSERGRRRTGAPAARWLLTLHGRVCTSDKAPQNTFPKNANVQKTKKQQANKEKS